MVSLSFTTFLAGLAGISKLELTTTNRYGGACLSKEKMEACVSAAYSPSLARSQASISVLSLLLLTLRLPAARSATLSADKSLVYGPGIDRERVGFPVNYFYIQAVDTSGKK